jgi:hypothetical protein
MSENAKRTRGSFLSLPQIEAPPTPAAVDLPSENEKIVETLHRGALTPNPTPVAWAPETGVPLNVNIPRPVWAAFDEYHRGFRPRGQKKTKQALVEEALVLLMQTRPHR